MHLCTCDLSRSRGVALRVQHHGQELRQLERIHQVGRYAKDYFGTPASMDGSGRALLQMGDLYPVSAKVLVIHRSCALHVLDGLQ
jgi:hypothetical protein